MLAINNSIVVYEIIHSILPQSPRFLASKPFSLLTLLSRKFPASQLFLLLEPWYLPLSYCLYPAFSWPLIHVLPIKGPLFLEVLGTVLSLHFTQALSNTVLPIVLLVALGRNYGNYCILQQIVSAFTIGRQQHFTWVTSPSAFYNKFYQLISWLCLDIFCLINTRDLSVLFYCNVNCTTALLTLSGFLLAQY